MPYQHYHFSTLIIVTTLMLSSCGGSDNNNNDTTTETRSDPVWTAGYYAPEASLQHFCEAPRSGIDPYTRAAYPDKKGSSQHEKLWLRSWSHNTYLWYRELPDLNPAGFGIQEYFEQLKTSARTASGLLKDNFHFSHPTTEYKQQTQSGVATGYGIEWSFGQTTPPRSLTIAYTEPGSPAQQVGLTRGATLLAINGIDFINDNTQQGVNILNAALFPASDGESYQFSFSMPDNSVKQVTLTSANIETQPVQHVAVLQGHNGKVGYMLFNSHIVTAQQQLIDAVNTFRDENISELVIDLRYNGGGLLALASQFAYMVAGDNNIQGRMFEQYLFNDKTPPERPVPFYNAIINYQANRLTNQPLPSLHLNRIFVLTTGNTCSASEAFINSLRGIDVDVIQIGETTCGKPYGFTPQDNCGTSYFTIQFQGVNAKQFGDYADGFRPTPAPFYQSDITGCPVQDDLTHPLGHANEKLLNTALYYMEHQRCPLPSATQHHNAVASALAATADGLAIQTTDPRYNAVLLEQKLHTNIQDGHRND